MLFCLCSCMVCSTRCNFSAALEVLCVTCFAAPGDVFLSLSLSLSFVMCLCAFGGACHEGGWQWRSPYRCAGEGLLFNLSGVVGIPWLLQHEPMHCDWLCLQTNQCRTCRPGNSEVADQNRSSMQTLEVPGTGGSADVLMEAYMTFQNMQISAELADQ